MEYIEAIENALGKKADKNFMPIQPGDVAATFANVDDLYEYIDFKPETNVQDGVNNFIEWYKEYYNIE